MTARNGSGDWHGDVQTGSGTMLIAAAQAGCFTMALAGTLASGGHPPDLLRTNATVHLRMHQGSITLARPGDRDGGTRQGHRRAAVRAVRRGRQSEILSNDSQN
jgi:hypothetical protein